jgi:hypothetical protein
MSPLPEPAIRKSRFDFFGLRALRSAIAVVEHNVLGRKIAANWWTPFRSDAHA